MSARDDLCAALADVESAPKYAKSAAAHRAVIYAEALLAEVDRDTAAVEAVLALHERRVWRDGNPDGSCMHDGHWWPCPTVRAITAAREGQGPSPAEAAVKRVEALCDGADLQDGQDGTPLGKALVSTVEVRGALKGERL